MRAEVITKRVPAFERHALLFFTATLAATACTRLHGPPPPPPCHVAILQEISARAKHLEHQRGLDVAAAVCREAMRADLDPLLTLALIDLESGYDAETVSSQGAVGLMQVMPPTGVAVARRFQLVAPVSGLLDPVFNVTVGIRYLADLRGEFHTMERALVAYNIGPPALHALLRTQGADFDATKHPFVKLVMQRRLALQLRYEAR